MNCTTSSFWARLARPLSIAFVFIVFNNHSFAQCVSKSNSPWQEWIANVTIANINNATGKTRDDRYVVGYSDWKDKTTTVAKGQAYPLSITPGLSWSSYQTNLFFRAWIDYNKNGIFEDTELVLEKNSTSTAVNQAFTIPVTATIGATTMRVSMKKDAYPTACETFAAGEVEDYTINIQDGISLCTATPPSKLFAKNITLTTAQLVWSKVNNATDYEYRLLFNDTNQPDGGAVISSGTTTDTTVLLNLVQGRLRAQVRSRCVAEGVWSAWATTYFNKLNEICTLGARTTLFENFENAPVSGDLPTCWSRLIYQSPTVYESWVDIRNISRGTSGNTTRRAIMFRTQLTDSAAILLVSPEISNLSAGTNRLRFKAANTWGADASGVGVLQIGTLSNPYDYTTFKPFGNQTVIGSNVFAEYTVDFATYRGTDRYFAFKYVSSGGDYFRSLEIDDVAWETAVNTNLPDLFMTNLNLLNNPVATGDTLRFQASFGNTGTAATSPTVQFHTGIYLSTDAVLGANDLLIKDVLFGQFTVGFIGVNALVNAQIPSTVPAGQYYVIAKIDDTNVELESNENNNIAVSNALVTVTSAIIGTSNCPSKSNAPWNEWIANVSFANVNNASGKTRDDRYVVGYSDWADKTATVAKGQSYPLSITPGLSWSGSQTNLFFRAWIDYNNNSIYEDTELVLEKNSTSTVVNQSLTIPATAFIGTVKMRISMKKDAYPTPCETFAAGEVEDYTVLITNVSIDPCATDVTPPVLNYCPQNVAVTTAAGCFPFSFTPPAATDNCAASPTVSYTLARGSSVLNITPTTRPQMVIGNWRNTSSYQKIVDATGNVISTTVLNTPPLAYSDLRQDGTYSTSTGTGIWEMVADGTKNIYDKGGADERYYTILELTTTSFKVIGPYRLNGQLYFANTLYEYWTEKPQNVWVNICPPVLTDTITYTATDTRGNKSTCRFSINVTQSTTAAADIALTIASTPTTYRQWTNHSIRVTAKNTGSATMTNIKVEFKRPDKMAFGGTKTPSVGVFNDYCASGIECSEWTIPTLAAGATATLDAPFFVLDAIAPIVATTRLLSSTPTDGNAANNTASVSIAPQTVVAQAVSKPTQLIPVVIQKIAPNPTDGELRVQLESLDAREVTFEFYNALGKAVKTEKKAVEKGLNRVEFSVFDFEQGVYFIIPSTSQGHKVPTKFVKM
jgi:hypothetical protein